MFSTWLMPACINVLYKWRIGGEWSHPIYRFCIGRRPVLPPHRALHRLIHNHAVQHWRLGCLDDVIFIQLPASKDEAQASVWPALGLSDLQPRMKAMVSLCRETSAL